MRPLLMIVLLSGCQQLLGIEDVHVADSDPEPPPPTPTGRCSTTHSFADDFEGALHPFWSTPDANPAVDGGTLRFAFPDPTSNIVELATAPLFDFRGSSISAEIIAPAMIGNDTFVSFMVDAPEQRVPEKAPRRIEIRLAGSSLEALLTRGDSFMTLANVPYDPALHRFWKLAEQDGEVLWSTSSDGTTYHELARLAVPDVFTVRPRIQGNKGAGAPPGYELRVDNVNAGIEPDPICSASTLQESFDGELDPYVWSFVNNATVANGSVVLRASADPNGVFGSIHPGGLYSLEGSGITVEIPRIDFTDATTAVTIIAEPIGGGDNFVAFRVSDMLTARSADDEFARAPYDPESHRFLRLRADRDAVVWEVSKDGTTFTLFAQTSGRAELGASFLFFDATATNAIDVELAGINAP